MQKSIPVANDTVKWPWLPMDVATFGDEERAHRTPLWLRVPLWIVLVWLVGVVAFIGLGIAADGQLYRHQLSTQASWIAQASQREATCLRKAQTDDARTVCATTLAHAVAAQQAQFDHTRVSMGARNAALQMHSAFDALYAAACYNPDTDSADARCLTATAPTLRTWATQEATSAENW
jgi:hypothetical protein